MKRAHIEYVLRKLGAERFTYSSDWVMTNCVLAKWTHEKGRDSNPSFGVRESSGISGAHCFSCKFSGGLISLIRTYGRYAIEEGTATKEEIDELVDYVLLAEEDTGDFRVKGMFLDQPVTVPQEIEDMLGTYHPYFERRGITEETAAKWNLGWHDKDDRVLFPVYMKEGKLNRLVGVIGRTVVDEEPKYRNYPKDFKKSRYLYGGWLVPEDTELLVVVEGAIDAIRVNQAIEGNIEKAFCVALMGSDVSEYQLDQLVALGREVCCMTDNDSAGKKGKLMIVGGRLGNKSYPGIGKRTIVSSVQWPEGEEDMDPGMLTDDEIVELILGRKFVLEEQLSRWLMA